MASAELVLNKRWRQKSPDSVRQSLEDFARNVEHKLAKNQGSNEAMANRVCKLITSRDDRVSAMMVCKWVEWRYGKQIPSEHNSAQQLAIQIINHIPRPGEPIEKQNDNSDSDDNSKQP